MKLLGMKVDNFLRIKSLDYQFDGKSVVLSGKNGHGKSSLIEAIWSCCIGKKYAPSDPRHNGEKSAKITLDLGELIVTRTFTEKGATLKITTPDGMKPAKPQALLDKLVGTIALDPHAFMALDPKTQMEKAAEIAGVAGDIENIDANLKSIEDDRRFANRQVRDLKGALDSIDVPAAGGELIDVSGLESDIDTVRQLEIDQKTAWTAKANIESDVEDLQSRIKATEKELEELKEKLQTSHDKKIEVELYLDSLQDKSSKLKSLDELSASLDAAREHNDSIQSEVVARKLYDQKKVDLEAAIEKAGVLDAQVKSERAKRESIIKNANLPVAGIDFSDFGLVYNGHPFAQASHAEKLRVSVGILMSQNPDLKLLTIKDASLMDSTSWSVVEELGDKYDFQVIYEVVSDTAEGSGLYIEDGALTHIDGKVIE